MPTTPTHSHIVRVDYSRKSDAQDGELMVIKVNKSGVVNIVRYRVNLLSKGGSVMCGD